jgi:predicted N-acetyltransferase YhbS
MPRLRAVAGTAVMPTDTPPLPAASIEIPAAALAPQFVLRAVVAADLPPLEDLHDAAFGPGALVRTAYRVREGMPRVSRYCRVIECDGRIIAAIRFTQVRIGARADALMLGPLMVADDCANQGHGRRLIVEGLSAARTGAVALVLLVGDPPYYRRFGFQPVPAGQITLPGPVDPGRLLAAELAPGALAASSGVVSGVRDAMFAVR